MSAEVALYGAPLWPAGDLPLTGGDRMSPRLSPIISAGERREASKLPISPLEGEMAGRPEGGALAPAYQFGGLPWAR
ncbi:lytic murein transglycosylase [Mesorhizobium sp. B2-3-2]|nr:lytic murein transglycosylase [Mesorhizobium sp. B2-3-2]